MPYVSDNIDLSAEWYYASNSYVSADIFLKNVSNFIVSGTTTQAITAHRSDDQTTRAIPCLLIT